MNSNIQQVLLYHEETKHSQHRYARSLGYMDWANQPNPFREYKSTQKIALPLAFHHATPPYHMLQSNELPSAPLLVESLSQFLQFSMGITAIKSNGYDEWALRANASSGNLHPSELYLILPPIDGICTEASLFHYAPKKHSLESLTPYSSEIFSKLKDGSFLVALSSITYREIWKYGERAFRYTHLDTGHAMRAVEVSANTLGWHVTLLDALSDAELETLLGFDDTRRFHPFEKEHADMLLLISPSSQTYMPHAIELRNSAASFDSVANTLSQNHQQWPLIQKMQEATSGKFTQHAITPRMIQEKKPSRQAKEVILKRRSAQVMDAQNSGISFESLMTILESSTNAWSNFDANINLVLFVHNVESLDAGLYLYLRNPSMKEKLLHAMDDTFLFQTRGKNLLLLKQGDVRSLSKVLSCSQNIASDGAFCLGMIAPLAEAISQHGGHRYKELYWECGAIGQQLYLEATSLGLSATGIGCFLDDMFHELLGIKNNLFSSLYHFTIGRALNDGRILTKEPYEARESIVHGM